MKEIPPFGIIGGTKPFGLAWTENTTREDDSSVQVVAFDIVIIIDFGESSNMLGFVLGRLSCSTSNTAVLDERCRSSLTLTSVFVYK